MDKSSKYRILVVNIDSNADEELHKNLESAGYFVEDVFSEEEAVKKNLAYYNMIISEVESPDIHAYKLAKMIRSTSSTSRVPVIFIVSNDSENERITAFSAGADDYIVKPYSVYELLARINAIIRRTTAGVVQQGVILAFDQLVINVATKQVLIDDYEIQMTKKEFELLRLFIENRNTVFSRDEIISKIWSEDAYVMKRTVDVNLTRIRKKLGRYERYLISKPGMGYCFEA